MNYQLKLKDGSTVDLSFSMYFLNRLCKLSGHDIMTVMEHVQMIGTDLEVMAHVLAASKEAANVKAGNFAPVTTIEGFDLMDQIPDFITSPQIWLDIGKCIGDALMPTGLPKEEPAAKKKAVQSPSK